jgi:integrase
MKGHIRRRGKNSWAVVIFLGRDPSGKQHRKWHAVRGTKRDAQRELARLMNEINTGSYVEPARMTVSEFLDRWLADYAKPTVSPKRAYIPKLWAKD